MKIVFSKALYWLIASVSLTMTSCPAEIEDDSIGSGLDSDAFILSLYEVNLTVGESRIIEVTEGSGHYSLNTNNTSVAKVTISGTSISIEAVCKGSAEIFVEDLVLKKKATILIQVTLAPQITLSQYEVNLIVGESKYIDVVEGSGHYSISTNKSNVAKVSIFGTQITIEAVNWGSVEVIVKDLGLNQEATISVVVRDNSDVSYPVAEAIDLGLPSGTKWASWNIGASAPEEYGCYYAWGETEGKDNYSRDTYEYYHNYQGYKYIGDDIAGTDYDVAHVKWGETWKMPTIVQINELIRNCTCNWTTQNGIEGMLVIGPSGASIFLPAAGDRSKDNSWLIGSKGSYWSSSLRYDNQGDAYSLLFTSKSWSWYFDYRYFGLPVRAVYL